MRRAIHLAIAEFSTALVFLGTVAAFLNWLFS